VVVVSCAWEDKTPVSKPSGEPTVNHKGDEDDRVDCEGHGEEAGGQEDGVLDRVEAGAREGGRVVALVVQLVDVLVQEPARIWSRKPVESPGMKKAVANVIVGLSQVGHEQDPHQMSDGTFSKGGSGLYLAIGDSPTVGNLENSGTDHTNCRPEGIMAHLRPSWKFWVDFEGFEPRELRILSLNLTTWQPEETSTLASPRTHKQPRQTGCS